MKRIAIIALALLAGMLTTGCQARSQMSADEFLHQASDSAFGSADYMCQDTLAAAKAKGVNYKAQLALAIAGNREAVVCLLNLCGQFQGPAAEGHTAVIGDLLHWHGDAFFASCVNALATASQRLAVGNDVSYDLGSENPPAGDKEFVRWFPRTYKACFGQRAYQALLDKLWDDVWDSDD